MVQGFGEVSMSVTLTYALSLAPMSECIVEQVGRQLAHPFAIASSGRT